MDQGDITGQHLSGHGFKVGPAGTALFSLIVFSCMSQATRSNQGCTLPQEYEDTRA